MLRDIRRRLRPLRLAFWCIKGYLKGNKVEKTEGKACWIVGAPDHKNLGDHAITYATKKFVKDTLPDYEVREITEGDFYKRFINFKKTLKKQDIIILQGGGNLGNLYQYTENIRRVVINSCKKNPIIMFPQSLYFTDDSTGIAEKKHTQRLYAKNGQIYYFAREKYTEEKMKEIFDNNRVLCVPDIVLSLQNTVEGAKKREGILCCLRSDKESALAGEQKSSILKKLEKFGNVEKTDTICDCMVTEETREEKLFEIWSKFASAQLVVTDRLHGMIFSVITNTPCIAISNNNKKILGVYHWIEWLESVKFLNSIDELTEEEIIKLISKEKTVGWNGIKEKYFMLAELLLGAAKYGEN